ncbi:PAS domain S-box protein [Halorubrum sp. BOL3-1]|uniref:PAS domain S-box protein n=1 Tax=Halorubrum sp. BOL3-1 TaxID=2497325 RepID=UPI0010052014|nr:PAS domain S-box protein [Halorubrum sp. BOL3-1]QAU13527.1 PAS domain S-box protein [Halorubrum sp. BOL3-1]
MYAAIDVLHVDDDPSVLDLAEAYFERELDSVAVTSVTDPETALERLDDASFDCVVSDYDMPPMNGLEFFDALRERDQKTPFVLYTGKGSEEIASQALNAGVTGYFQKGGPDQLRRLANRVDQAVEESRTKEIADRYSTVIEALNYPVYVVDEAGTFEFVNEAFAELTGYDRDEIIGSKPDIIKGDEAVDESENRLGTILSSSGPDVQRFRVDIAPKDGEPIPCQDHMAALPYEGEFFDGSVGILRDVSEGVERRRELETKTRALDEAPVGIAVTDPGREDNPMVYVNDRFVEMSGYSREEAIGVNCRLLQGPDTDEESVRELREAIDAEEPTSVELLNYRKDGSEFWNRVSVAPIRDVDGEVTEWVGFQQDITAFKEREVALERQNDRLDSFASIVSHDLRNPLNVAQGRVQLARDASGDAENLDAALDAIARMESIVERTLALAREGETVGDPEYVALADIADDSWSTVDTASATLSIETDRDVLADPDRLRNLFENLMRNAVNHAGPDVSTRVGDLPDGFFVEDDGPGIDPAIADSLFEPGESGSAGNTGFGLAIVEEIATAHGWTVEATTGGDGGARFEVRGVDKRTPAAQ